jgi:hypothetical protein
MTADLKAVIAQLSSQSRFDVFKRAPVTSLKTVERLRGTFPTKTRISTWIEIRHVFFHVDRDPVNILKAGRDPANILNLTGF